jgi:hypothetical protein
VVEEVVEEVVEKVVEEVVIEISCGFYFNCTNCSAINPYIYFIPTIKTLNKVKSKILFYYYKGLLITL